MDKQVKATISFISRGNLRGGYQWSTKSTTKGLKELGFTLQPYYPPHKLVQCVHLSGTRDEVIAARRAVTRYLRQVGSRKMAIRFEVDK